MLPREQQIIEMLRAENEALREEITRLKEALGQAVDLPVYLGLTTSEARVIGVLLAREAATKDTIMASLYRDGAKDEAEIKIVDVFICKARKKLAPFGITIETVWGQGYRMTPPMKAKLRELATTKSREAA